MLVDAVKSPPARPFVHGNGARTALAGLVVPLAAIAHANLDHGARRDAPPRPLPALVFEPVVDPAPVRVARQVLERFVRERDSKVGAERGRRRDRVELLDDVGTEILPAHNVNRALSHAWQAAR